MDVHVILPQDGLPGGPPTSLPCHPYPHDAASFHTLARTLVTPLCLHSVSTVGGSTVVVGGEVSDDDKEPVVRALALAACGEMFSMLHAAREAFPEEVGEPRLRFSAAFLEAEGGAGGGEGIIDALADVPGLPLPPSSPRLLRASPFTPGAGTPVAPLPSSRGPHISDDPSCGHGIVGIQEVECTSIEGVAQVLFALPTSPKEAPPTRRHHAVVTITLMHPPRSGGSGTTPTSPGGGMMGHTLPPFSRLSIFRLARASLPPPPPGAPKATPPPCPTWVSAVAEVLTAVENRTINVPFAASRATLLLKSVLTGKGKGIFLALPPSSPPMVATQTLQFARRLGAASHTLYASTSTTTKGGAFYNTPTHSGPPSSAYLPNASPRHAALALSTVVGAAAVGFAEREAEGGRGGSASGGGSSSGQGLKSPGGAMPPPLQSLREEEEEGEEGGGGGEEELNGDNFTVLSPSPPRPTLNPSASGGGNNGSSKKQGFSGPALPISPAGNAGDARSSSTATATSDLTSLLSVDLANTSRALFAGTLSALEASRAECLSLQSKMKAVVEERERAVAAAEAATAAALAAAQAATGNPSVPSSSTTITTTAPGVSEEEVATLRATVASLTSKNKSLTRAASDYEVYRGVVEASLARLQGDVARVAGERDALGKQVEELKVSLSRERRACGTLKTKCAELEYKVVAFQSGSVGKGEAAAAVNALKGALEEARVAGGVAEATNQELKAAAGEELELLRWRVEELSRALGDEVKKRGAVEAELDAARGQIMDKLSGDRSEGVGGFPYTTLSSKPPLPQPSSLQQRPSSQVKQRSILASPEKAPPQQQQQQQQQQQAQAQQRKAGSLSQPSKPPQEWDGRGLASLMGANVTYAQTIPPLPPNTQALADALDDEEEASFATALGLLTATRPPSTSVKQQQQQQPPPPPRQSIIQAFQAGASARERNRAVGGKQQQQQPVPPPKAPTPTSKAARGGAAVFGASKIGAGKQPPPPSIEQELGLEASFETAMLALLKK